MAAPQVFSAQAITELVKLEGRAKITFPTADTQHFRVERVIPLNKIQYALLAFDQPDQEYPLALLKAWTKIEESATYIKVAVRYEVLPGLPLRTETDSWVDLIPAEFRAAENYTTTETKIDPSVPGAMTPDAVSATMLSSSVHMETAVEGTKTNITRPEGAFPTIVGFEVGENTLGETAEITRTIGTSQTPAQGLNVINSAVTYVGGGQYLTTTTAFQNPPTWPVLLGQTIGSKGVIPEEFLAALQLTETITRVDPAVSPNPDALSSTVIESYLTPEEKSRSVKHTTSIAGSLPTLTGHEADAQTLGISGSVVRTLVADGTGPATGYLVLTSTVMPLGNGLSVNTTTQVPSWPVLENQDLGAMDLTPLKFRALIGVNETITRMDATLSPAPDALSSTILESNIEQVSNYLSIKRTKALTTGTTATLTGHTADAQTLGVSATVTEQLVSDGTAPSLGWLILTSRVEPLGNGKSISTTEQVASWPVLVNQSLGDKEVIPQKFKSSIQLNETITREDATLSPTPDALSATVLESTVDQETFYLSIKRTTALASSSFPTLAAFELNARGQSVTIAESIVSAGTVPSLGTTTVGASVEALGSGLSLETTRVVSTLTSDTFTSLRQTGGNGAVESTQQTYFPYGTNAAAITWTPSTAANVISDRIEEDTLQHVKRVLVQLTDTSGTAVANNPVYTTPIEYDKETKVQIFRSYQLCLSTATPPALSLGTIWTPSTGSPIGYVIDARVTPLGDSPCFSYNAVMEVETVAGLPAPLVDYIERGYEFPAIFTWDPQFSVNTIAAYYSGFPPPWPGTGAAGTDTFCLVAHRQVTRPMRRIRTYSFGPTSNFQTAFKVITPGVSSRLFQIPPNCIHAPITVYGTFGGNTYTIENIPASSPAQYSANSILVVSQSERPVLGMIYEQEIIQTSEDLLPSQFGPYAASLPFSAKSTSELQAQPDPAGELLYFQSTSASDTQVATIYGRRGAAPVKERITLNETTFVSTAHRFTHLASIHLASAAIGTISCYGSGTPNSQTLEFFAQPTAGDTVHVVGSSTVTYTFQSTMTTANDVQIGATYQQTAINLAQAINNNGQAGTVSPANYYTSTVATGGVVATVDATDQGIVHVADNAKFFVNTSTYAITLAVTGGAIVASPSSGSVFAGSQDGPTLTAIASTSAAPYNQNAYQDVFLNASGLLFNGTALALSIVPNTFGTVQEGVPTVSASTDGTPTIPNNLPPAVSFVSDPLFVPVQAAAGNYSFGITVCVAGTPALPVTYDLGTVSGSTFTPVSTGNTIGASNLGNGKVYTTPVVAAASSYSGGVWARLNVSNSANNFGRAVYGAVTYIVPGT